MSPITWLRQISVGRDCPLPMGARSSTEEQTRGLVNGGRLTRRQRSSHIEILGFGNMRASVAFDRIGEQRNMDIGY